MPNLYATPNEIKLAMPDGIRTTTTNYDGLIYRLADLLSRAADRICNRRFSPKIETRYYDGDGKTVLWIDDLISITSLSLSSDGGQTYTALAAADYHLAVSEDLNGVESANTIVLDVNGDYEYFNSGMRSVKIVGTFGYHPERASAWQDTGIDLSTGYTSGGTALTVADINAEDRFHMLAGLHYGRILKIDEEIFEVTSLKPTANQAIVLGAQNGSTAANHLTAASIYYWQADPLIGQAVLIQAVRQMQRGFQGFGDARATADIGELLYVKAWDPEAWANLMLRRKRPL